MSDGDGWAAMFIAAGTAVLLIAGGVCLVIWGTRKLNRNRS